MDSLAPHGGCNWEECKECFPPRQVRKYATLRNTDMPDHQVEVIQWDFVDDAIPGYSKVRNSYGWTNVVKTERLTNYRDRW